MLNKTDETKFSDLKNNLFSKEMIDYYVDNLLHFNHLPLVLTNKDLKKQLQISDSTLNRLIRLESFPNCWFGIRGHYLRDDILEWIKKGKDDDCCEQFSILRSL